MKKKNKYLIYEINFTVYNSCFWIYGKKSKTNMQNLNTKNIIINPDLNLKQRLLNLFDNQYGVVVQVYDEIVHCIGMPNVKIGEIVLLKSLFLSALYIYIFKIN